MSATLAAFGTTRDGVAQGGHPAAEPEMEIVEKTISTTNIAPLRGEGTVYLSRDGDRVKVTISDLSLGVHYETRNWILTGLRIGLLSPERREKRIGPKMAERFEEKYKLEYGDTYETEPFFASFEPQKGAALEDYEVCLWVLQIMNGGQESMVFAHTGGPAMKGEFTRRRLPDPTADQVAKSPVIIALRKELRASVDGILASERQLRSSYSAELKEVEAKAYRDGFLHKVVAARKEQQALVSSQVTDLSDFEALEAAQLRFLDAAKASVNDRVSDFLSLVAGHLDKIETQYAEAMKNRRREAAALKIEAKRFQDLLSGPDQLAEELELPWIGGSDATSKKAGVGR